MRNQVMKGKNNVRNRPKWIFLASIYLRQQRCIHVIVFTTQNSIKITFLTLCQHSSGGRDTFTFGNY